MLRLKIGLADGISHPAESNLCHTAAKTTQQDKGILGVGMKVHKAVYRQSWVGVRWQQVRCNRSTYNFKKGHFHLLTAERWKDVTCLDCLKYDEQHSKDGGK